MGKSNFHVFNFYLSFFEEKKYKKIAFFGQDGENDFSRNLVCEEKHFYDMSLGNWEINTFPYPEKEKYDLIVCTRCAYFCKDPVKMIESFSSILKKGGRILLDWGLGDHWRFKNYKVGWIKNKEQEWAYKEENFLWSCLWSDSFESNDEVKKFKHCIRKFGYNEENLEKTLEKEVTTVLKLEDISQKIVQLKHLFLWPEAPQLYTCILLEVE